MIQRNQRRSENIYKLKIQTQLVVYENK